MTSVQQLFMVKQALRSTASHSVMKGYKKIASFPKQALIADNFGDFVSNHGGGRWGGMAAGFGASLIPGVMAVDSAQAAGRNFGDAASEFGRGNFGKGIWQGVKGLTNTGIGALSLIPGTALGMRGMKALGTGLKGMAGTVGGTAAMGVGAGLRAAGGAARIGRMTSTGNALSNAGKALSGNAAQWGNTATNAFRAVGNPILNRARQFSNTTVGRHLNNPAKQLGTQAALEAPDHLGAVKNWFTGGGGTATGNEGYAGGMEGAGGPGTPTFNIPGMLGGGFGMN